MCNWSLPQNTVHLLVEILLNIFGGCQEIDCPGTHWGRNQDKTGPRKFSPLQMAFSSLFSCVFNITFWPKKKVTSVYSRLCWFCIQCRNRGWTPVWQCKLQFSFWCYEELRELCRTWKHSAPQLWQRDHTAQKPLGNQGCYTNHANERLVCSKL